MTKLGCTSKNLPLESIHATSKNLPLESIHATSKNLPLESIHATSKNLPLESIHATSKNLPLESIHAEFSWREGREGSFSLLFGGFWLRFLTKLTWVKFGINYVLNLLMYLIQFYEE